MVDLPATTTRRASAALGLLVALCAAPATGLGQPSQGQAAPTPAPAPPATLLGRPVQRGGLHFMVAFGWGGGPTSNGLLHSMELGHTFRSGLTLAYNHVFIWSDGLGKPTGGSDLFGGHMLVLKLPLGFPEIVAKVGVGLGENVDLSDGFEPRFGFGWTYGLDIHLPLLRTSGLTLTLLGVHASTVDRGHQVGFAAGVGYTWF